jgi:hypothetical protein
MATRRLRPNLCLYFNPLTSDLSIRPVIPPLTSIVLYLSKLRLHPKKCRRQPKSPNSPFASFRTSPLILQILYKESMYIKSKNRSEIESIPQSVNPNYPSSQMHHLFSLFAVYRFLLFPFNCTGSSLFSAGLVSVAQKSVFACDERRRLGFSQGSTRRQHPTGHHHGIFLLPYSSLRTQ